MQVLENWNNLFTKGLQIHSSFLLYLFLIFCEFQKNQNSMLICTNLMKIKFKYIKRSIFEKLFSTDFLEFTLVFLHIFSRSLKKIQISNSKIVDF
jgi:hypothetical protein